MRPAYTWILSDTHWHHDAICRPDFESRPADHLEVTLANCRRLIAKQDELIHLGDVIFYKNERLKEYLGSIECLRKILVRGNHDKKSRHWYESNGFDFACDRIDLSNCQGITATLTHIPLPEVPPGHINIHGHWHSMGERTGYPYWWGRQTHYLVALEINGYKPERLDSIISEVRVRTDAGSHVGA